MLRWRLPGFFRKIVERHTRSVRVDREMHLLEMAAARRGIRVTYHRPDEMETAAYGRQSAYVGVIRELVGGDTSCYFTGIHLQKPSFWRDRRELIMSLAHEVGHVISLSDPARLDSVTEDMNAFSPIGNRSAAERIVTYRMECEAWREADSLLDRLGIRHRDRVSTRWREQALGSYAQFLPADKRP